VQAHGLDAMVDEDNCVFFLPHRPRCQITGPPFFLFMKGTGSISSILIDVAYKTFLSQVILHPVVLPGWCGAGADHYEPLIAHPSPPISQEKVAFVL